MTGPSAGVGVNISESPIEEEINHQKWQYKQSNYNLMFF